MDECELLDLKISLDLKIKKFEGVKAGYSAAIDKIKRKISDNCDHPPLYVKPEQHYFPGSYLDLAYTEHWNTCTICGARSEVRIEQHSWYG